MAPPSFRVTQSACSNWAVGAEPTPVGPSHTEGVHGHVWRCHTRYNGGGALTCVPMSPRSSLPGLCLRVRKGLWAQARNLAQWLPWVKG